jgi:hypothetical protein
VSFPLSTLNVAPGASTFGTLFTRVNTMIDAMAANVVSLANTANGGSTSGNGFVNGVFSAVVFAAATLRGGNVQSAANLAVSSNVAVGNSTANVFVGFGTVSVSNNLFLNSTSVSVGNSTVFSTLNSTSLNVGNAALNGVALSINSAAVNAVSVGNSTVNVQINSSSVKVGASLVALTNAVSKAAVDNVAVSGARSRFNFQTGNSIALTVTSDASGDQVNVKMDWIGTIPNPQPAGSNTFVQFDDSGNFGGNAGFTYDKSSNSVFSGNNFWVGNSTVNSVMNQSGFSTGNSTVNTVANSSALATSNVFATTRASVGNSTVNVTANSTTLNVGPLSVNTTVFQAGANVAVGLGGWGVGNSTVNTAANSTTISSGNTFTVNGTAFSMGNSSFSLSGNSTVLLISNSTFSASFSVGSVKLGNSTVNVSINTSMVSINGGNVFSTTATGQNISGGSTYTSSNQGTKSTGTFTIDPGACQLQYITANGAFTLAAPAADGAVDLLVTNGASAGAITFSGFTVGSNIGDPYVTTSGFKFVFYIRRINGVSTYQIRALQ